MTSPTVPPDDDGPPKPCVDTRDDECLSMVLHQRLGFAETAGQTRGPTLSRPQVHNVLEVNELRSSDLHLPFLPRGKLRTREFSPCSQPAVSAGSPQRAQPARDTRRDRLRTPWIVFVASGIAAYWSVGAAMAS
jgi:hypothetical protein